MKKSNNKKSNVRYVKYFALFLVLFVGTLILPISIINHNISANSEYKSLDFTDTKTYSFVDRDSYGDLETDHWELTKTGDDFKLVLKGVRANKINLPFDVADENCSMSGDDENACGTKPRKSKITVEILGEDNIIYGRNSYEDGFNAQHVKELVITGDGKLKMDTTHGMGLYTDVKFEGNVNYDITSLTYGIRTNHSMYLNGGNFKIKSAMDALAASDDIYLNGVTFDGKTTSYMTKVNGKETFSDKSVIYAVGNVNVENSHLTLREGSRGILATNISINKSEINDDNEHAGYISIQSQYQKGSIIIANSTINVEGGTNAIKSGKNLTITSSKIDAVANERRASVVEGNGTIIVDGNSKLNLVGIGNGLVNTFEKGTITLGENTDTYIRVKGRSVADKTDADGYAIAGPVTIKDGAKLLLLGPKLAFLDRPKFEIGSYYLSAGRFAEGDENLRYPERKSVEKFTDFYTTYRYVEIVRVDDLENPTITGYEANKVYCGMPTITVSDDVGIWRVEVNKKEVTEFTNTTDTSKTFVVPASDNPTKEIVVTDVSGKTSSVTLTAYSKCAVDINNAEITLEKSNFDYDSKAKKPTVTAYYSGKLLKENVDYKLNYLNNVNSGTASVEIIGISGYKGKVVKTFKIEKANNILQGNNIVEIYSTKDQTANIKVTQKDNAKLTYTSNNNNVKVDNNGNVIVKGGFSGKATITIKSSETNNYKVSTTNIDVIVNKLANELTVSNVSKNYSTKDQSFNLNVKQKGNATLTYKSNNKNVIVDKNGKVTIKKNTAGGATITVTAQENTGYKSVSKTLNITINKINNNITASNVVKTYSTRDQTFKINAKQSGNGKLTYKSNNKNVTVDKNGKVKIKKKFIGSATLTITSSGTAGYNSSSKSITLTVNPSKVSLSRVTNVKSKKMSIKWKRDTSVSGYEIQYTTDKKFKSGVKSVTISKNSTTSKTITKLTKNKKYYVRIRSYKTVSGKKYYSSWSSVKNVKIKR